MLKSSSSVYNMWTLIMIGCLLRFSRRGYNFHLPESRMSRYNKVASSNFNLPPFIPCRQIQSLLVMQEHGASESRPSRSVFARFVRRASPKQNIWTVIFAPIPRKSPSSAQFAIRHTQDSIMQTSITPNSIQIWLIYKWQPLATCEISWGAWRSKARAGIILK